MSAQPVFEKTLWQETEKFVSKGLTYVKLRLTWASPCPILRTVPSVAATEMVEAESRCMSIFTRELFDRVAAFNKTPLQPSDNNAPTPQYPSRYGREAVSNTGPDEWPPLCQTATPDNHTTVGIHSHLIAKRDLGLGTLTAGVATYAVVSNVFRPILDRVWPSEATRELREAHNQLKAHANELTRELNAITLALECVEQAVSNQALLIEHNSIELAAIRSSHPQLMLLSAHMVASRPESTWTNSASLFEPSDPTYYYLPILPT